MRAYRQEEDLRTTDAFGLGLRENEASPQCNSGPVSFWMSCFPSRTFFYESGSTRRDLRVVF